MALTAIKKAKTAPRKTGGQLKIILDQLDREMPAEPTPMQAYYQACVRVGLHWIGGDPACEFPEHYQGQRLAKMCRWLTGLPSEQIEAARAAQLAALHAHWPVYAEKCTALHEGTGVQGEILGYTWAGLDSLWSPEEPSEDLRYFPKFACVESENFHLISLAALFLNRETRRPLSALELP